MREQPFKQMYVMAVLDLERSDLERKKGGTKKFLEIPICRIRSYMERNILELKPPIEPSAELKPDYDAPNTKETHRDFKKGTYEFKVGLRV